MPLGAFLDDNHTTVMTVSDGVAHIATVSERATDGKSSVVTGLAAGTQVVSNGQLGLTDGERVAGVRAYAVRQRRRNSKAWLTRAFIQRPTLVLVLVALVMLCGIMALRSLVVQQFPNVENPVVRVGVSYSGASTTEMRDSIVVPIENQLAGTPDMVTLDSTVQNGQASISATFTLESDQNTDLVYVQRAVQAAQRQLPSDLVSPTVNIGNPAEVVVATIGVSSKTMNPSALSLLVTGVLDPAARADPRAFRPSMAPPTGPSRRPIR